MPNGINSTYLALIPKIKNANDPKDFRPISCFNIIYKILASILANRLKPVLTHLVGEAQSAFIKGRNIVHNISLAQQRAVHYGRKNTSSWCMVKIDISKAYDVVCWRFIESMMNIFGFPKIFFEWVMACISTAKFSVMINGALVDFYGSSRGLGQGDPISPLIFTVVMDVLSKRLNLLAKDRDFQYAKESLSCT